MHMRIVQFSIILATICVASTVSTPPSVANPSAKTSQLLTPTPPSTRSPFPEEDDEDDQSSTLCINCGFLACPPSCGQQCVNNWYRCSASSAPCCNGWSCVSRNARFRRCEPPAPKCTPKWWRCRSLRTRCCHGWRCVWAKNLRRLRCEPPRKKCIPKWWHCRGVGARCCGGWRCIRSSNSKFRSYRCEP